MKNFRKLMCLAVLSTAASGALAKGDAGCGLGGLVISSNSRVSQTLAVTTNYSTGTQLFGITTGTSGCSGGAFVQYRKEAIQYAETNFESLKIDVARGSGQKLETLAMIMGCQTESLSAVSLKAQQNFEKIVPENADPVTFVQGLESALSSDQALAQKCQIAG